MRDILLLIAVLAFFVCGYFAVGRVDRAIAKMKKASGRKPESAEPFCVLLQNDLSDGELIRHVREYSEKHPHAKIVLYDAEQIKGERFRIKRHKAGRNGKFVL